ncbi:MAG: hypothetical protein P4M13_10725 [Alphaproteobacteria bacterium]|nr:hypothetical protein [Alphaproteobacteria bacterium]
MSQFRRLFSRISAFVSRHFRVRGREIPEAPPENPRPRNLSGDRVRRAAPPRPTPAAVLYAAFFSWPGDAHKAYLDTALAPVREQAANHAATIEEILATVTSHVPCLLRFLGWLRGSERIQAYPPGTPLDQVVVLRLEGPPDPAVTAGECLSAWRQFLRPFKEAVKRGEEVDVASSTWWPLLEHHAVSWCGGNPPPPPPPASWEEDEGEDDEGQGGAPAALVRPRPKAKDDEPSGPKFS